MSYSDQLRYRKITTRKGIYFVPWQAHAVARLFISERLTPADLCCYRTRDIHQLIRELYLLACSGALEGNVSCRFDTAILARYAHTLRSFLNARY